MPDIVARWRDFEAALHARGLGWALHYAPVDLRWALRTEHRWGARLDHLLPADYRAFVAEIGYPVLGYDYYDDEGLSFLPPEPMARLSTHIYDSEHGMPRAVQGEATECRHAVFAGNDLSDVCGYALAQDGVWLIEDSAVVEYEGDFTQWLLARLAEQEQRIADLDEDAVAELRKENEGDSDPHRLLDYSLGGSYDQTPYSAADLQLGWVERQSGDPYSYGLVDGQGDWRIPLGKQYRRVRPFHDGVAEVILNVRGSDYDGPWSRIDPDGRLIDEASV